jgi:hypothetical protein
VDEMQILEQMCATVAPPDADHLARLRARVLDSTTGARVRLRPTRVRLASARRAQLAFAGCALAAAAALIVTLVSTPHGSSTAPVRSTEAARILQHAADVALTQPVAPAGQFVYTAITGHHRYGPLGTKTIVEQMWQSADGSRAGAVRLAPCSPLTPGTYNSGVRRPRRVGNRLVPPPRLFNSASTCVLAIDSSSSLPAVASYAGLRRLPENPSALLAYISSHVIRNQIGGLKSQVAWNAIQDILRDNPSLPPTVAAALFRAAATLPGTMVQQHVTDAAGRPGLAVAMQYGGLSSELIFDPSTYRFMGSADIVTGAAFGEPMGTVLYTMAVLHTAIVTSAPRAGSASYLPAVSAEFTP